MTYLKLLFDSKEAADEALAGHDCSIAYAGHLIETPATFNESGDILTEPILSDKYAVDVIFRGDYPTLVEEVTPMPNGQHTIYGMEDLYLQRYNELNP